MDWEQCIRQELVRKVSKNSELSKSLRKTANDRIKEYAEKCLITDKNARFIVEEYYEAIMEFMHSLLALHGFKCYSHECAIEFLREFYSKRFSKSEIIFLHRLRMLRNDIKYEGRLINKSDAEKWVRDAQRILNKLLKL